MQFWLEVKADGRHRPAFDSLSIWSLANDDGESSKSAKPATTSGVSRHFAACDIL